MLPCSVDALESHGVARAAVAEDAGDLCVQIVVVNVDAAAVGVGEGVLEQDVVLQGVEVSLGVKCLVDWLIENFTNECPGS